MHRLASELCTAGMWNGEGEEEFHVCVSEIAQAAGGGWWLATVAFVTEGLYL